MGKWFVSRSTSRKRTRMAMVISEDKAAWRARPTRANRSGLSDAPTDLYTHQPAVHAVLTASPTICQSTDVSGADAARPNLSRQPLSLGECRTTSMSCRADGGGKPPSRCHTEPRASATAEVATMRPLPACAAGSARATMSAEANTMPDVMISPSHGEPSSLFSASPNSAQAEPTGAAHELERGQCEKEAEYEPCKLITVPKRSAHRVEQRGLKREDVRELLGAEREDELAHPDRWACWFCGTLGLEESGDGIAMGRRLH
eukprot:scaffold237152_cov30-Tisochrysis_lutea.AAC.8